VWRVHLITNQGFAAYGVKGSPGAAGDLARRLDAVRHVHLAVGGARRDALHRLHQLPFLQLPQHLPGMAGLPFTDFSSSFRRGTSIKRMQPSCMMTQLNKP